MRLIENIRQPVERRDATKDSQPYYHVTESGNYTDQFSTMLSYEQMNRLAKIWRKKDERT